MYHRTLGRRASYLPFIAWLALSLTLIAPAMCQRHGLLYFYFHAAAPESSPAWADDFMCGTSSAPSEQHADAQHHTARAIQSSLPLVFLTPEQTYAVETAPFTLPIALEDASIVLFAPEPLSPPPRCLSVA
ncbi:MAG: hypothetical protein J7551_03490 [Chloroflexi bacterium]|nr:hypothetical protein [Chloroflexota bacterium]